MFSAQREGIHGSDGKAVVGADEEKEEEEEEEDDDDDDDGMRIDGDATTTTGKSRQDQRANLAGENHQRWNAEVRW